ncbi:MFS transporter, ACS family, allantoate permease, partial [Tremellales sp. Uapishka_1]
MDSSESRSFEDKEALPSPSEKVTIVELNNGALLTAAEEKKMWRKVDWHLLPCLAMLYLLSYIDRGSLANASIFGYKKDLHISTTQYNLVSTIFFFSYAAFEVPANALLTKFRPSVWITIITLAWGIVMTLSGIVKNYSGALAARFFLGVCEAGFFPGAIFLTSMWYPRKKLQGRISVFYAIGTLSGAFSGLIAYGIHHMVDVGGLSSWRWIFILEGLFTVVFAACVFLGLPDDPNSSKWLSADEKIFLNASAVANGAGGGHMFKMSDFVAAAKDPKVWALTWLGCACSIPAFGFSYTLPSILVALGYEAENAQLLTVPIYAFGCIWTIFIAFLSDRLGKRYIGMMIGFTGATVGLAASYALPKHKNPGVRYFFLFWILAGLYSSFPGVLSWASTNAAGRGKRAMAGAIVLTIANLSSAIGTNTYLARQAPHYQLGYGLGMAVAASGVVVTFLLQWYCKKENAKRDAMDEAEIKNAYSAEELEAMGDASPLFRYAY